MGNRKKKLRNLGLLTTGATLGVIGLGTYFANYALYGRRQTLEESREWQENHYDISWFDKLEKEAYVVTAEDDYKLHTFLLKNPVPANKYVIISHGYSDTRYGSLKYARLYLKLGFNCIIYDLRGHGENEPTFCTYGIREGKDLATIVKDTVERYGENISIGLQGESLGSSSTVASLKYLRAIKQVKFAVSDCGFCEIMNVLRVGIRSFHLPVKLVDISSRIAKYMCGYTFKEMRPIDSLNENRIPIMFIHGDADDFILPVNSHLMFERTKGYRVLHLIPEAKHAESVLNAPTLYLKYLRTFLQNPRVGCVERK